MTVTNATKPLFILLYFLFAMNVSVAAAIQKTEKGDADFGDAAAKIEKLLDSNVSLAHSALKKYGKRFDDFSLQQKITYQNLLTDVYVLQGKFHSAKDTASTGLALTLKLSSPSLLISELLYSRGFAYESMGDYDAATSDYERGLELAKSLHDNVLTATGLINLGAVNYLTDRYEGALIVLNEAYNIAKKTNDDELKGSINSELGILYALLDRNEQAMVYYQQAYQHYKNAHKIILSLNALVNIALNYLHEKEYEQAITTYKMIIAESEGTILNQILYSTYSGLSWANLKKENPNPEASYQYLLLSKQYMGDIEQYNIELQYYTDEAFVLFELDRFDEAIDSIAKVENILAQQMPLAQVKMQFRISITNLKSKTYFKLGHYQKAYELQEQRLSLTREMRDKNHIQSVAEVRLTLEAKEADLHKEVLKNEQKVQEVSLLEAEKQQQQQKLYLFYIAVVALIFAWLLIKLIQGQHKLYYASSVDMLTGIANRRILMKKGAKLLANAKAKHTDFSVMMINIDYLNKVNVQLGYSVGDQVLKNVVELASGFMGKVDVFGRFSGEEFIAFLPNTPPDKAHIMAELLRASVENFDWQEIEVSLKASAVSVSIGIASTAIVSSVNIPCDKQYNLALLINRADSALSKAKQQGRNRVCS